MSESDCSVCAAHDKALKETPYTPLACPECKQSLMDEDGGFLSLWSSAKTVIAARYDEGPFEHTEIFECSNPDCRAHFTLTAQPVIWNANHDIFCRKHPGD